MRRLLIEVKPVIAKPFTGSVLVIDRYISFYGEVDVENSVYKPLNIHIANKVLVFKGSRGSTVGSYVIYGLSKRGGAPIAMIVKNLDPVLVSGCVLTDIPLLVAQNYDDLIKNLSQSSTSGLKATYRGGSYVEIEEQ